MIFPHCDTRVLHAPGECEFCDMNPEWQELRQRWGIAFTGHEPAEDDWWVELPCPADYNRGDKHQRWGGNRPAGHVVTRAEYERFMEDTKRTALAMWEKLRS